ncbi:sodium:solute symporter family protein [Lutispora sp.]|uniref:sodium:solute symporter family protein n=1 Tax=Lutispora sp. TaxID=2828727 RepID=UPI000EDAE114|nr:sodium:solute symporter family protein [Lutispora sp.]MEA4960888.1 sodium:solute symporter family protein [Lutispora sp.]HCJ58318.1 sodium:solute symporter [Clostridiaceae bacterium]
MLTLTYQHIIGIVFTLFLITLVGAYSGRMVKNSSDFSVGGKKAGAGIITGTIMGTLVGGASTIGTAQLAFLYGFSAWWFTLGAGIGCLILALFFSGPLHRSDKETVPQILAEEFGGLARPISSIFVSLGTFLNIIAQILSAVALLTSMFKISPIAASVISIMLMSAYVIFGGVWGTGLVGVAKLILLYISVIAGGIIAVTYGGGIGHFVNTFPSFPYFSLFGRGVWIDGAAGFSLVLGVLSTQTYIQAVLSGKTLRDARTGSLISAFMIPPIGIAGIFIGLFMKMNHPNMNAASAFPRFVLEYMSPWLGGIVLATLLVAVVGTGAGLALGISTIFTKDIYKNYINKNADDDRLLKVSRWVIVVCLVLALLFTTGNAKSLILKWSFMSMGLRGATVFMPLCAALFMKGKVKSSYAICSMVISPISVMLGKIFLPQSFDPLFLGVTTSILITILGMFDSENHQIFENKSSL